MPGSWTAESELGKRLVMVSESRGVSADVFGKGASDGRSSMDSNVMSSLGSGRQVNSALTLLKKRGIVAHSIALPRF